MIDKALHRKLNNEQYEPHSKPGVNSTSSGSGTDSCSTTT